MTETELFFACCFSACVSKTCRFLDAMRCNVFYSLIILWSYNTHITAYIFIFLVLLYFAILFHCVNKTIKYSFGIAILLVPIQQPRNWSGFSYWVYARICFQCFLTSPANLESKNDKNCFDIHLANILCPLGSGGFPKWGYPNGWMVYNPKSPEKMENWGYPHHLVTAHLSY